MRPLSAPSSFSNAVLQAFSRSQMDLPQRAEHRVKQNVLNIQRPCWARWFKTNPSQESTFYMEPSKRESTLHNVEPPDEPHGRISLSRFPDPPTQNSNDNFYKSNAISTVGSTPPSEILMCGGGTSRSDSLVFFPIIDGPPRSPEVSVPYSVHGQSFSTLPTSPSASLSPRSIDPDYHDGLISPGSRARVISNSNSRHHRSIQVEISVLPQEHQSLTLDQISLVPEEYELVTLDHPSTAIKSRIRTSWQPYNPSIVEEVS
jgi:hypothetical protein